MRYLLLILLLITTNIYAVDKYKIITSTKTIGYQIKGSQAYTISSDSATAASVFISSYAVTVNSSITVGATVQHSLTCDTAETLLGYSSTNLALLNSTQTFTGLNTFTKNVTVSSLTFTTASVMLNCTSYHSLTCDTAENTTAIASGNYFNNVKVSSAIYSDNSGNADTVDTYHASSFPLLSSKNTFTSEQTVSSNVYVSGNVGIRTTSPTHLLEITSSLSTSESGITLNYPGYPTVGVSLWTNGNTPHGDTYFDSMTDDSLAGIHFRTKTSGTPVEIMTLYNGNVGIGTTDPSASKLVVIGTITAQGFVQTCKIPEGVDYLDKLKNIKAKSGETGMSCNLDHSTLPEYMLVEWEIVISTNPIKKEKVYGQDIGMSVNTTIKAIQQLQTMVDSLIKRIETLEKEKIK